MEKNVFFPTARARRRAALSHPPWRISHSMAWRLLTEGISDYRAGRQAKINLVRYADDFIITGALQALLAMKSDLSWNNS